MRQSGKTTRLVDSAIQHLFENGYIRVLTNHEFYSNDFLRGFTPEQVSMFAKFMDPDSEVHSNAQREFIERLNLRIRIEHLDSVIRISPTEFRVK